jgi:Uma2 family endonuclease
VRSGVGIAAYLHDERNADTKHELWSGEVFAMAGASYAHNQIVANLAGELRNRLRDRPCDVLPSDMKVFVPTKSGFVYPDVVVVCEPPRFLDEHGDVLLNPSLVVEVLSENTERFDRGEKFAGYRSIPSLQQVVLVAQHERRVELFTRSDVGWMLEDVTDDGVARLGAIGCELPLGEIYLKVLAAG